MTTPSKINSAFVTRAKARRFMRLATVMSGENKGFGAKVERVILDPSGKACTDGKTIWLPLEMNENPKINNIMQEAVLAHECAHHRYTDFTVWDQKVVQQIKKGLADRMLHQMTNMIEDARINHLFSQDYAGAGRMLDFTHQQFMMDHKKKTNDNSPIKQQAMVAMMSECIAYEAHWSNNDRVIDFMDEVRPILTNATKQQDTNAVVNQAQRVLDLFRSHFPDDEEDPEDQNSDFKEGRGIEQAADAQKDQGRNPQKVSRQRFQDMKEAPERPEESNPIGDESTDGNGDGSDGDGDGEDQGEGTEGSGDAEGSSDGSEGSSDGSSDSDDAGEGEAGSTSESDQKTDGDGDQSNQSDLGGYGGQEATGDWEESWADLLDRAEGDLENDVSNAQSMNREYNHDLDEARRHVESGTVTMHGGDHQVHVVAAIDQQSRYSSRYSGRASTFAPEDVLEGSRVYDQVARTNKGGIRILQNEMTRRIKGTDPAWTTNQRSGRVDTQQVWRLASDPTSEAASRIFKTVSDPETPNANVIVLIDASGSMGGKTAGQTNAQHASDAAVVMSEVLDGLNFNYEVIDFSTSQGTTMRVRKAFGGSLTQAAKATLSTPYSTGCNADGYAVQWCLDRLKSMGGNQILIVISDGQPAGNGDGPNGMDDEQHLISVVANAPKHIGIVSVGIAGMDTSEYYPNAVKVNDTSNLSREMLPVLRTMLRKVIPVRN